MGTMATTQQDKQDFLQRIDSTYAAALETLQHHDPLRVVHADTNWRVKDLIAHVVTWENEMARALYIHRRGGEIDVPDDFDEDDFNANAAHVRYGDSMEQIYADWSAARGWLKVLIGAMTPEQIDETMRHPWGKTGTVRDLINSLFSHLEEHMAQITGESV